MCVSRCCCQVRVVLPEGAEVVRVKTPFEATRLADERRFTYLDTPLTGRPVITLTASNIVAKSNGKLEVRTALTVTVLSCTPRSCSSYVCVVLNRDHGVGCSCCFCSAG
jgi:hypothetical protein